MMPIDVTGPLSATGLEPGMKVLVTIEVIEDPVTDQDIADAKAAVDEFDAVQSEGA